MKAEDFAGTCGVCGGYLWYGDSISQCETCGKFLCENCLDHNCGD